jgi:hypothetical protein
MNARIQSTPEGRGLGAAFYIPAKIIEQVVEDGADSVEYTLKVVPDGILVEIGGGRDVRVTKPRVRLCNMACAALWWVLRKLLLDLIIGEIL